MRRIVQFWGGEHWRGAAPAWVGAALLAGVLAVYLRTLAPGALGGDPGELQFVPAILSMPHPTGTPLYCLLGKAWSLLPLGPSVAWRMNLLAAVSASLAVVVVYRTVHAIAPAQDTRAEQVRTDAKANFPSWLRSLAKQIPARLGFVPPLAAALSLAFGLTFWEQALLADKYAFNALLVALVLYLALRWGQTRSAATLNWLAVTYGLSLAHHRTMALLALPLLGYVWWHERSALWQDGRRLVRLALLCLLPLLLYLYLPWAESRGLPPGTWHPRTAREWYDYLFDTGRTGLVYVDPADLGEMLLFYERTLLRDFTWVGVTLGVGGLLVQIVRRPADALFLLAVYVLQAFLAANHHVPRHWVYFIPSFVIFALWVGTALSAAWSAAGALFQRWGAAGRGALALLALAMLAWPVLPVYGHYQPLREAHLGAGVLDVWRQTLKEGHMADRVGMVLSGVEPGAVVVCDWEQATPLWYYQQVEGLRPDAEIVYPVERLDEAAALGRPLYIARAHPGLADRWHPWSSGALIALRSEPAYALPAGSLPLEVRLGQGDGASPTFALAGFAYGEATYLPATVLPLTLYWRALQAPGADYSVSLRVFDEGGVQIYQVDSQHPVLGTYPTSRWTPGEVVADYYEIQLRRDLPPGLYHWGAVLYRALPEGGWESLRVEGGEREIAPGGSFTVQAR
jgi:hypothetical protein